MRNGFGQTSANKAARSITRGDPGVSRARNVDALNEVIRQSISRRERLEPCCCRDVQTGSGTDPNRSFFVCCQACDSVIEQAAPLCELRDLAIGQFEETLLLRADP